jgi:cytidyltransferase-like protein
MESANNKKIKVVMVSGGFDPVHVGHVRMFNEAKKLGDKLIVVLNNDNWLKFKKGVAFMPENERKEVIESFAAVDEVIITEHKPNTNDISICKELELLKPDIFANGGDRKDDNIPEYVLCKKLGIEMVFNVGGGKIQSSSELLQTYGGAKKGHS